MLTVRVTRRIAIPARDGPDHGGAGAVNQVLRAQWAKLAKRAEACWRLGYSTLPKFLKSNFAKFGCTPSIPKTLTCDILDTNAVVDFGSFSNDVTARQATGTIKVNCSSEAYLRVKFNSNVTNMPLSQDGRLTASLKFEDLIAGVGDNYVKVPWQQRNIYRR